MTRFGPIWTVLRTGWAIDRRRSVLSMMEAAGVLLSNFLPLGIGYLVTGAAQRDANRAIVGGLVVAVALGAPAVLTALAVGARLRLRELLGHHFDREIARLMSGVPTVEHMDAPQFHDQAQLFAEQQGSLGQAYNLLINALNNLVVPLAAVVVALLTDLRLLWLLPAALPGLLGTRFPVQWERAAEEAGAEHARRSRQLLEKLAEPAGGAEIRTFAAGAPFRELLARETQAWRRPHQTAALRTALLTAGSLSLYLVVAASVLRLIVRDASAGSISPGVVATAVLAVGQTQSSAASARRFLLGVAKVARTVERFAWLEGETSRLAALSRCGEPAPLMLEQGVVLESVAFTYRGCEQSAVCDVTVALPASGVVAIVGANGSGKSTLIKLLSALYRPTAGRIKLDGRDLADIHPDEWRKRCSATFQDHLHLELEVRDGVGVGDLGALDDLPRIQDAIESARADAMVRALPLGVRTRLGRTWADGTELSGGQWQRLSLARARMRREPLILLLDEPTSALDAFAEDELVQRYSAAAASGSRGLVVVVTHRISTVRAVDLILVMHEGRLIEAGSHSDLVALGGHYAELFSLQASGYR